VVFVQKVQLCSAVVFPEVMCIIIFRIVVRVVPESGHRSKVFFVDYDERLFFLIMFLQPYTYSISGPSLLNSRCSSVRVLVCGISEGRAHGVVC
jgi:hypothetical protein